MGEKRDDYVQKVKAKIDKWNIEIDKLAAKTEQVKADAQAECRENIEKLKVKRQAIEAKITELRKVSGVAWQDVKAGVDGAKQALGKSIRSAKSRFN